MADRKITELTALAAGSQATGDLLAIVDVSETAAASKNKKITVESLFKGIPGNVGVGTSAPNSPGSYAKTLEVSDGDSASIVLSRTNSTAHSLELGAFSGASLIESTGATVLRFKTNSSERMRIDGSGNVGIGTSSPSFSTFGSNTGGIHIKDVGSSNSGIKIEQGSNHLHLITSGSQNFIHSGSSIPLAFSTNGSERMRIDSSGRLLVGTTAAKTTYRLEVVQDSGANLALVCGSNVSAANGPFQIFTRSRGSTSNPSVVLNGDTTGVIEFRGYSGAASAYRTNASISAAIDGTPDSGGDTTDMPGRLVFSTTADGNNSPTERMRIDKLGNVAIGTASIDRQFHVQGGGVAGTQVQIEGTVDSAGIKFVPASGADQYEIQATDNSALIFYNRTDVTERMRVDSSGRLLVGLTSPLQANDKVSVDGQVGIGGQRYGFLAKNVTVGNSVTFDIGGAVNNAVFVRVRIKVGYSGNSNYQMHAQYDYITCNFSTTGGTATITNIAQIEAGNAQFNTSDWSVSRPANSTVRLTYSPSSGAGTHHPTIYVDGLFSTIT